jgi:hypothetical protein
MEALQDEADFGDDDEASDPLEAEIHEGAE